MKTIFKNSLIIVCLIFTGFIHAGGIPLTTQIKARKLIIASLQEDKGVLSALQNDPVKLMAYKKAVEEYNINFVKCIKKYWTFHTEIISMPLSEIHDLAKNKSNAKNYVYLRCLNYNFSQRMVPMYYGEKWNYIKKTQYCETSTNSLDLIWLDKLIYETNKLGRDENMGGLCTTMLTGFSYPSEADIAMGMKRLVELLYIQNNGIGNIGYKEYYKTNGLPTMEGKTLLLENGCVDSKLISKGAIDELPFKVKFVDKNFIEQAIINDDPNYACLVRFMHGFMYVVSTEKGSLITKSDTPTFPELIGNDQLKGWVKVLKQMEKYYK